MVLAVPAWPSVLSAWSSPREISNKRRCSLLVGPDDADHPGDGYEDQDATARPPEKPSPVYRKDQATNCRAQVSLIPVVFARRRKPQL